MTSITFLRRIPLFKEFSADELERLQHIFQEKEYKKNQVVIMAEETTKFMYIVKFGEVKVVQTSRDGRENILAIHHSGETFGEMALLDGNTTPATVVAMEDSKIITISKEHFDNVILKSPKAVQSLLRILCKRLRESWRTIQVLKFTDAETRLKYILMNLSYSDGIRGPDGVLINTKITHQELAELAGTSRETISRLISKLQQKKLLKISSHRCMLLNSSYWQEP